MDTVVEVELAGNRRVNATVGEHVVRTDQCEADGGDGSAPTPFDLFLASLATCAGNSAVAYCRSRDLPTEDLALRMICRRDEAAKRYARIELRLSVPPGFPERHRVAIGRAMDLCSVKRHVLEPPEFDLAIEDRG